MVVTGVVLFSLWEAVLVIPLASFALSIPLRKPRQEIVRARPVRHERNTEAGLISDGDNARKKTAKDAQPNMQASAGYLFVQ